MNSCGPPLQVIAVCNRKGGAGKTTTSVNLAAELAHLGRRVLLLDLDSQGHCAVGLGIKAVPRAPTVHSLFADASAQLIDAVCDTPFERLSLAGADQLFEHGSGLRDETRLTRALSDASITSRFDVVVVDTPPSLDLLLLNALSSASWVLVPFVPHPLSYEGVRQLMRMLYRTMSKHNPDLRLMGFLPVMAGEHIRQHRNTTGDVARQYGVARVFGPIRTDIKLAESFAAGQPCRHYAPASRGAQDYAALGVQVADIVGMPPIRYTP